MREQTEAKGRSTEGDPGRWQFRGKDVYVSEPQERIEMRGVEEEKKTYQQEIGASCPHVRSFSLPGSPRLPPIPTPSPFLGPVSPTLQAEPTPSLPGTSGSGPPGHGSGRSSFTTGLEEGALG